MHLDRRQTKKQTEEDDEKEKTARKEGKGSIQSPGHAIKSLRLVKVASSSVKFGMFFAA